ncbi:MAG: hypothetical protein ACE5G0_17165 [Rhodothermales bacterium]
MKKHRPLAGAADLQRKLTRMAQAGHSEEQEEVAEEVTPSAREKAPAERPKRGQTSPSSISQGRSPARSKTKRSARPAEVETMLTEGRTDEAVDVILQTLAESDAGSRHVQVKMPAWLYREWSIYVATQGREVREVLLSIILEKLAEGDDDA